MPPAKLPDSSDLPASQSWRDVGLSDPRDFPDPEVWNGRIVEIHVAVDPDIEVIRDDEKRVRFLKWLN